MQGSVVERNGYYPFGSETALGSSYPKLLDNRMKFNGKEEQTIGNLGLLDYGARMYDPAIGRWTAQDPLSEKYYSFSAYNYCVNNPVMFVDLDGRDTINVTYNNQTEKWEYSAPILNKGNDIIVINGNGIEKTITFSEGLYGERVLLVNLTIDDDYTLGLYHVSGKKDAIGFYITPGGDASEVEGSNKRIPEGVYPMTTPEGTEQWRVPGIGGSVLSRGIRFHPGKGVGSTLGCHVLCSNYTMNEGLPNFSYEVSVNSSMKFYKALGDVEFYNYKSSNGRTRIGTKYKRRLQHQIILKSF